VKGTQDILPDKSPAWQHVESVAGRLFDLYGYREVRTPMFERTELFARGIGEETDVVSKEMYTFEDRPDKDGNRDSLTLRPEGTAGVVRAVIENSLLQNDPLPKVYMIGPMFRAERAQRGRYRQFHQVDVEAFGMGKPVIDVEIIELALTFLSSAGLKKYELVLNSVGDAQCRPQYIELLRAALRARASELCEDCQRRTEKNPLRVLDCKVPEDQAIIDGLPKVADYLCIDCKDHFDEVRGGLTLLGIPYRESHRLVRGLDYYTRTTFEVVTNEGDLGAQNTVLGGGRYDGLVKELGGPDVPGMGFAAGLERLILALPPREDAHRCDVFLAAIGGEDALDKVVVAQRALRMEGVRTLMDPEGRSLKSQMKKADKLGAGYVVIVGDEEVARGVAMVRNMADSQQKEVPLGQLVEHLKEEIGG
jgi:histidyl-tRNA synthetase